jgi:rhamnulokinase
VELDAPIIGEASLARNLTNEGGYDRRIRLLRNNMGLWLLERCKTAWAEEGERLGYDDLVELARRTPPFRGIIDPDDGTFLNPPHMPSAIVDYCRRRSLPVPETRGEIVRTILESLALKYRFILDGIGELRGKPIRVLHVVGGGSRNALLNQFTADAAGLDVLAGPAEATAAGNILIQAVASGEIDGLEEARAVVRESFPPTHFEPRDRDAWEARFEEARRLFQAGSDR